MKASHSDALVLFGVTGDLAHKMIFPALYAMVKRGTLNVPVIGVALPKWSLARLHKRVTESIEQSGRVDNQRALNHLLSLLKYVSGDYDDPKTFTAIKRYRQTDSSVALPKDGMPWAYRTELVTHFPNSRSLSLLLSALFRPIRPRRPTLRATMDSGGQVPGGAPQGSPITKNTKRTHFPP